MAKPVTLDDVSALCDEMVALTRVGIPLDEGLLHLASDLPKQLADPARDVAAQLANGCSLADVVAEDQNPFPLVYQSIVEAGMASGKLSSALEGFARVARSIADIRRTVVAALVYPMVLMATIGVIAVVSLRQYGMSLRPALIDLRGRSHVDVFDLRLLAAFEVFSEWFWLLPATALLLGFLWWLTTRFATAAQTSGRSLWVHAIPGAKKLLRFSRVLSFVEVMQLLVAQQVPLQRALRLAGAACGDAELHADANQLAEELEGGQRLNMKSKGGIPPFLRWHILHSQHAGQLELSLARAVETYRRRTQDAANWLRLYMPILFSAGFGGVVALLYAATVFLPWYSMLRSLAAALEAV